MTDVATLIIWFAIAAICYYVAERNDRHPGIWAAIGLLTGIFGLIVLLVIGKPKDQTK